MKVKSFPLCCAAMVFTDFGHTEKTGGTSIKFSKEQISKWIKHNVHIFRRSSFIVIALNNEQDKAIGDVIREFGFRCVANEWYSGHKDYVKLYVRNKTDEF